MKLSHTDPTGIGTFEALEFLELGMHGKAAMWRALSEISPIENALAGVDFERLIARAGNQERIVEEQRLMAARSAFAPSRQT